MRGSTRTSGPWAMPTTTPWWSRRSGCTRPNSIRHEGPWCDIDQAEVGTAGWVQGCNIEHTRASIDDLTAVKPEQLDYALIGPLERAG